MNYNHLYHFHMIAEEGSLSRAAERLALSPSTLSEQLKNVESFLNEKLFERRATGLTPTHAGRRLHHFTSIMFHAGERLLTIFDSPEMDRSFSVDIGVTPLLSGVLGGGFTLPLLNSRRCFVRIHRLCHENMLLDLANSHLDLILIESDITESLGNAFEVAYLFPLAFSIVSSSTAHFLRSSNSGKQGSIPFLHYTYTNQLRWEVDKHLAELNFHLQTIGEVDDISIAFSAVKKGLSAAVLPLTLIHESLENNDLIELAPARLYHGHLHCVVPRDLNTDGPVAYILSLLIQYFKKMR